MFGALGALGARAMGVKSPLLDPTRLLEKDKKVSDAERHAAIPERGALPQGSRYGRGASSLSV